MGRRKWKIYQDGLIPKRNDEISSDEESMPATDPQPALKIKTIEEINAPDDAAKAPEGNTEKTERRETILESLIKRPATQPKLEMVEEPTDWKPPDKCYFCVDGERAEPTGERQAAGARVSIANYQIIYRIDFSKNDFKLKTDIRHRIMLGK